MNSSSFFQRLLPAPVGGGFAMDDYWIWCPSVLRDDTGLYHMFASRWPRRMSFSPHWLTNSEIVRATSPTPEGPYHFQEVVLPARGSHHWDGRMTHNPSIRRAADGTWLLFYTGSTYDGDTPTPEAPIEAVDPGELSEMPKVDKRMAQAHRNQKIGLATAPSPAGPWKRNDHPILEPRPDKWDALLTTNPAPCVCHDGRVLLIYKSVRFRGDSMFLGVSQAEHYAGPYERLQDEPILRFGNKDDVEDPYVWCQDGFFHLIMKDMEGGIGGERRGGIKATSRDGIRWTLDADPKAYSRHIKWQDRKETFQDFFERTSLLLDENGCPTHLFAATATGSAHVGALSRSWNMVIPLRH